MKHIFLQFELVKPKFSHNSLPRIDTRLLRYQTSPRTDTGEGGGWRRVGGRLKAQMRIPRLNDQFVKCSHFANVSTWRRGERGNGVSIKLLRNEFFSLIYWKVWVELFVTIDSMYRDETSVTDSGFLTYFFIYLPTHTVFSWYHRSDTGFW